MAAEGCCDKEKQKCQMSNYKKPPEFNSKVKPYKRFIEELKAWGIITQFDK